LKKKSQLYIENLDSIMAITKRVGVLIMYFALVYHVGAAKKVMPTASPDIFKDQNVAKDKLAPGEKINNVLNFGAKADGKFDCTQVFLHFLSFSPNRFQQMSHIYKHSLLFLLHDKHSEVGFNLFVYAENLVGRKQFTFKWF